MSREWKLLIEDILESIKKIKLYTNNLTFEDFCFDTKTVDAVVRNFEIIGEASKNIHLEIRDKFPEIEWKTIIGLRNRIIHEYFGVDNSIIWFIIENELSDFENKIKQILNT